MSAAAPEAIGSLLARQAKGEDIETNLGAGVLVGTLPSETADGWTYRTAFNAPVLPPSADGSGLSNNTLVWALRKTGVLKGFQKVILVGRAESNDVVLAHSQVSKLHARIRLQDGSAWLMDAASSNGTFLEGERLKDAEVPLKDGSTVGFGAVVLTYFSRPALLRLLTRRGPSLR